MFSTNLLTRVNCAAVAGVLLFVIREMLTAISVTGEISFMMFRYTYVKFHPNKTCFMSDEVEVIAVNGLAYVIG